MSSLAGSERTGEVDGILEQVKRKGIELWLESGELRYRGPRGALSRDEIERLRSCKSQIVATLQGDLATVIGQPAVTHSVVSDARPLSYAQLSHFHLYELHTKPAIRQIAAAIRLAGQLNIVALRQGFAEVIRQHSVLRTRILIRDGIPAQAIAESSNFELQTADAGATSGTDSDSEIKRMIDELILEPIDVTVGPLFGARLLRVREDEHVLILAMEHIISDEFSMNVLIRDLLTAYRQALTEGLARLAAPPVQFVDYAAAQRASEKSWILEHGKYWQRRLQGISRLRFPETLSATSGGHVGWGYVPLQISREFRTKLLEWCRVRRTTLVMGVFTAYVGLVLRWCNAKEGLFQYQTDGRVDPEIENAIGFFAWPIYMRLGLDERDSFVDLLCQITEEYCAAHVHADRCYFEAQSPRPEFTRSSAFNWVPAQGVPLSPAARMEDSITCSPLTFEHPMLNTLERDNEPVVLLYDTGGLIFGGVYFPRERFALSTMERFAQNFSLFLKELLVRPGQIVGDVSLV